jgi:hypothetical protein
LGDLLETTTDVEELLGAAGRVLTEDGTLTFTFRNASHAAVIRGLIEGVWIPSEDRERIRFFTAEGMESLLRKSGFQGISFHAWKRDATMDSDLLNMVELLRPSGTGSREHLKIAAYSVTARKVEPSSTRNLSDSDRERSAVRNRLSEGTTLVIRAFGDLARLRDDVLRLAGQTGSCSAIICVVPSETSERIQSELKGLALVLGSPSRILSASALRVLAERSISGAIAIVDQDVRLGSDWTNRLTRHLLPDSAVGPLVNQIAGAQSIYHYLNANRVDPDEVESLSQEIQIRYPAITVGADWLYDQVLVFGRDILESTCRLPDENPINHFSGLAEKLRKGGARLLVAKDVYARFTP